MINDFFDERGDDFCWVIAAANINKYGMTILVAE